MVGDHGADQHAIEDVAVLATLHIRAPPQREWDSSRGSTGSPFVFQVTDAFAERVSHPDLGRGGGVKAPPGCTAGAGPTAVGVKAGVQAPPRLDS